MPSMTVDLRKEVERLASVSAAGPVVSLVRPFDSLPGLWAVVCGALAGSQGAPERAALVPLLFVLLLVSLGWAITWQVLTETDWFHPQGELYPPRPRARLPRLPYAQAGSPAGRLWAAADRAVDGWRDTFWPAFGGALGVLTASLVLVVVFGLILYHQGGPPRQDVRRLSAAFVALAGVGLVWRRHGQDWLVGRALVLVALPWLAGHLTVAQPERGSTILALTFTLAWWGAERLARGLRGGRWLLGLGQAGAVALLVVIQQPLAAGAAGALLLVQLALLPAVTTGADPARVSRRARPWLAALMLLAALALP